MYHKKRILLVILVIFGVLYLSLPTIRPPTPSELSHPQYALIPPGGSVVLQPSHPPSILSKYPKTVFSNQPVLFPSFFVTSPVLKDLLSSDANYARLLSKRVEQQPVPSNPATQFGCLCGRVSDACVCCGPLSIPVEVCQSQLPTRLCGPLVLFSTVESSAAHFCLNVTYHPKKQQVDTAGFLIPENSPSVDGRMDHSVHQFILNQLWFCLNVTYHPKKQQVDTAGFLIPENSPSVDGRMDHSVHQFILNQTLVLFDSQIVPVNDPPVFCVENSRTDPEMGICIQLSNLRYFYDIGSDHKTVFTGCAQVSALLKRQFVITRSPPFCFRAHRGAAGDVDQAAALAQRKPDSKNEGGIVGKYGTNLSPDSPGVEPENSVLSTHTSTTPSLELPQKVHDKKIAGSLDAHDALPMVP
ncbi:hypothetical protein T265_11280 [Opisthorchis viverrini]|uniref:DUF4773 domain-containing protein n=1 Tax=Opisthorchis viverrini TaxID=6198 RepID=A0A074Z3K5_OPIVI|nr:hypothetical protein T265_11280 [Opisthorchis viverrini]KER20097.1 hypothetical protein T265_11280 [Opisthorchis viverrini]